ncbi:hypothetical protein HDV05_006721 [Chytridiales sp. JEL 0842]|nr:hypothetical protein HDV05_006721 [Chytridiales sp. JEL 0842]
MNMNTAQQQGHKMAQNMERYMGMTKNQLMGVGVGLAAAGYYYMYHYLPAQEAKRRSMIGMDSAGNVVRGKTNPPPGQ